MLPVMIGGIHQHPNQHFDRSGTPGFQCVKQEFVWAMATLCNACIAWLTVAE
jgi:hypothetical protein